MGTSPLIPSPKVKGFELQTQDSVPRFLFSTTAVRRFAPFFGTLSLLQNCKTAKRNEDRPAEQSPLGGL